MDDNANGLACGFHADADGKIFGMEPDEFMAGYAELASEVARIEEFGFVEPSSEEDADKPNLADDFLSDIFRPMFDRWKKAHKIADPRGVRSVYIMRAALREVFGEKGASVKADLTPSSSGNVSVDVTGKRFVLDKDGVNGFLAVALMSNSFDAEALADGGVRLTIGCPDFWKAVSEDEVQ